jgi:RNA polymerase sigma-70 factor (ECF subfamily)
MAVDTSEIWEEFSSALRRFILNRVRDEHAAEDILQDAFYKIHKNIDKLEDERKLRAWLYQITRNTIIDYYRKRGAMAELPEMPENMEHIESRPGTDADVALDLGPCVKALMDRLPDRYKEPLFLTEFEGLTQKEMGDKLGLSVSGAKSRVQRGKAKLKDMLHQCCDFELDRRGNVMDYKSRSEDSPECCGERPCE